MSEPGHHPLAIVAGRGNLPKLLAEHCVRTARPYRVVRVGGMALDWLGSHPVIEAEFERFGALFEALHSAGCTSVVFAGGMERPNLDPARFDAKTLEIVPKLIPALGKGDDTTLRAIAGIFEAEGFAVEAAHSLLGNLIAPIGALGAHSPTPADLDDVARALVITEALGRVDVGQGAVVAQGLCLGLESLQGTDRMLEFVAASSDGLRPDPAGAKGVLLKRPKPGQDLRMDMPAIGPDTVRLAANAGLAGIAVLAGGVLVLDRAKSVALADKLGLFVYGISAETP